MTKLSVNIKPPAALTAQERQVWAAMREENPALYSPYFHFCYTELLGQIRSDVHVLIVSQSGNPIAFLPFHAKLKAGGKVGFARPIGAPMTDYHGFVCKKDANFNALAVLKKAGFGAFHFSAAVNDEHLLQPHARMHMPCTVMDISGGSEAWRAQRDSSYRRHLKSNRRRTRKSEEFGARRVELKSKDTAVFEQLINWKQEKFSESGKYDVLSAQWTQDLLRKLWNGQAGAGIRADMHALYFGESLAAIDLGITDGDTFHSWMVAYNNEFYQLAPGIQLLEELLDASEELGYKCIDLGEGLDGYKRQYASEDICITSGFIAVSGSAAALSQIYGAAEKFGETKLGSIGKLPGKARRRYAQIHACEPSFSGRAKAMLKAVKSASK